MNGQILFKTNIAAAQKVRDALSLSQTMTHRQIILSETNQKKLLEAKQKLNEAIQILSEIK
jgi:hypothetical protein